MDFAEVLMKRTIISIIILAVALVSVVSCLKDTETEKTPQAAITSFVVGYYNVRYQDIDQQGNDSITYYRGGGVLFPMTIDQVNNRIYNIDSLDYGSDVDAVTTSVYGIGTVLYYYSDNPGIVYFWSGYDSIDFTPSRGLVFRMVSSDGTYTRDYKVQLNVRKVFPDSLLWSQADSTGFTAFREPCAVILNDSVYNFGLDDDDALGVVSKSIIEGKWTAPVALSGIPSAGWKRNVITSGGRIYAQSGNTIYGSLNGKEWTEVKNGIKCLVRTDGENGAVWAVDTEGNIIRTADMSEWTKVCKIPEGFPDSAAIAFDYPLATNKSIQRTVLAGLDNDNVSVWTTLSTDTVWSQMDAPANISLRLPVMQNLSVIRYDDKLYAFGKGLNGFRQSGDNGITWYWCSPYVKNNETSWNRYMQLPKKLKGYDGDFSYAVDRLGSIWLMTADGQVWRGAVTRLDKRAR
jgi:hypothetical protein